MLHHSQVMGNDNIREFESLLNIFQKIDHLCLNRDIPSRDRFTTSNELRVEGESSGDSDPLSLTTAYPTMGGTGMLRSKSQTQFFENHISHPLELCYKDF
jgi:hypothetical protein